MKEYVVQEKGANAMNEYGDGVGWVRGSMIGKGSYGRVYLATPKNTKSNYICFPSEMAVKSAEVSVSGTIQKEREIITNLNGSPYLIECFGEEETMGDNGIMAYNLLLEYGSGGTLADRIKKTGGNGLPESEARAYTRCILRGLDHIHGSGYVHCDLKPDNILLVPNSDSGSSTEFRAKIGDFGSAKRERSSKKRRLEPYWRGTPMYLSPEAVIDSVQEAPNDIWALGCVVLEMLTGKPAWDGKKAVEILRKIRAEGELPKIPNELSEEAKDFLKCCFVRKAGYRATSESLLNQPFVEGLDDDDDSFDESEVSGESVFEEEEVGDNMGGEYMYSYLEEDEDEDAVCSTSGAAFHQSKKKTSELLLNQQFVDDDDDESGSELSDDGALSEEDSFSSYNCGTDLIKPKKKWETIWMMNS